MIELYVLSGIFLYLTSGIFLTTFLSKFFDEDTQPPIIILGTPFWPFVLIGIFAHLLGQEFMKNWRT